MIGDRIGLAVGDVGVGGAVMWRPPMQNGGYEDRQLPIVGEGRVPA